MHLVEFSHPLVWGNLDLPLFGIAQDWFKKPFTPPAAYSLAVDPERLWFVATHTRPGQCHPEANAYDFIAKLWRHDVAELFLADPESGRYLELNLAPNGAWWSGEFTAPRQRAYEEDIPWPGIQTFADATPNGGWIAAMALDLAPLRERLGFGTRATGNVTFILNSPDQRFLSANDLGDGEPDYHRPNKFSKLVTYDPSIHEELQ